MAEKWMPIEGFEGLYEVSNYGRVKSLNRIIKNNGSFHKKHERILKQNIVMKRKCTVVLCKDGKTYPQLVHRLVAKAFIPNPENKPVVDHIDTDPTNNHVSNLRWVTVQGNCLNPITRIHNSVSKKGHKYYGRKLTKDERNKIRQAKIGKQLTNEHKQKISIARKKSQVAMESSLKALKKAHEANRGKNLSDETKDKIREKMIGVHKGKHWKLIDGKRVWY